MIIIILSLQQTNQIVPKMSVIVRDGEMCLCVLLIDQLSDKWRVPKVQHDSPGVHIHLPAGQVHAKVPGIIQLTRRGCGTAPEVCDEWTDEGEIRVIKN